MIYKLVWHFPKPCIIIQQSVTLICVQCALAILCNRQRFIAQVNVYGNCEFSELTSSVTASATTASPYGHLAHMLILPIRHLILKLYYRSDPDISSSLSFFLLTFKLMFNMHSVLLRLHSIYFYTVLIGHFGISVDLISSDYWHKQKTIPRSTTLYGVYFEILCVHCSCSWN